MTSSVITLSDCRTKSISLTKTTDRFESPVSLQNVLRKIHSNARGIYASPVSGSSSFISGILVLAVVVHTMF